VLCRFLDASWQLVNQFPEAFEFNADLLLTIADELYSCQFGTFLFNTEAERRRAKLEKRTFSLWDYVEEHRKRFTSHWYLADPAPLLPNNQLCLKNVTIWREYHFRWGPQPSIPSWNFFETKKLPPPLSWPTGERITLAHAKRSLSAAVARKTAPLQAEIRKLKAQLKKAKAQIAELKGESVPSSETTGSKTSSPASVGDSQAEEATSAEAASVAATSEESENQNDDAAGEDPDDEENWAAIADAGGARPDSEVAAESNGGDMSDDAGDAVRYV